MKIGYARISTGEQTLDLQLDALEQAGCEQAYKDVISGAKDARPGLDLALSHLRPGDTLVVWKLDRLGRTLKGLIELMTEFQAREVGFQSLTEQIDTTTPGGKLIFHVFGALAEFERDLITERTRAGLAAARARGRVGGHPRTKALDDPKKVAIARSLYANKTNAIADICRTLGVSKATLYRYLKVSSGEPSADPAAAIPAPRPSPAGEAAHG
jgi:DNA invertase Pin-like site-specific DNA recombinase